MYEMLTLVCFCLLILATVTISQVNKVPSDSTPIINLGDVQLLSKGVQIPAV